MGGMPIPTGAAVVGVSLLVFFEGPPSIKVKSSHTQLRGKGVLVEAL